MVVVKVNISKWATTKEKDNKMGKQSMGNKTSSKTMLATVRKMLFLSLIASFVDKVKSAYDGRFFDNKHHNSAGRLLTSTTGAVTPLIVMPASIGAVLGLGLVLIALMTFTINNNDTYATASSISLSLSSNAVSLNVAPSSRDNGSFGKSAATTISASTTNATGYTLGIKASGATNYNKLVNADDNNLFIESISSAVSESDFSNNDISTYNNKWGYLPSNYCSDGTSSSCDNNTSFLPAPNADTGDILGITECANGTTNTPANTDCHNNNDTYNITIGARINYNQTPGAYRNTFVITAVANAVPYTITYNANGGDSASMPANVDSSTFDETVTLSSTTPTKTNHDFTGWCTVTPTNSAGVDACTGGTTYAAGSNWTLNQTSTTNALTLYAMWNLKSYNITVNFAGSGVNTVTLTNSTYGGGGNVTTSGGTVSLKHGVAYDISGTYNSGYEFSSWATAANGTLGSTSAASTTYTVSGTSTLTLTGKSSKLYMQNMAASDCTTTVKTVYDNRDETAYHVQRLADGNCWMLDNLALDLTNSTVLSGMTVDNTNASNTTLGYLKGTSTGTKSDKYATAKVANWTSSYSYSAPRVNLTNKDVIPQGDDPMASTVLAGEWKVGGYYNYCAASAGSYCYGNGTNVGTSSGNATEDICPKGWRMPAGNTTGAYSALANAIYGSTDSTSDATAIANYRSALHLPLSGYFNNGTANSRGSYGRWWSSTRYNDNYMYYLNARTSNLYPANNNSRSYGYSVRCILGS